MAQQGHRYVLVPYTYDQALTPQQAADFGFIVEAVCYPWKAYTGKDLKDPNDWSRKIVPETVNVYTDMEAGLRDAIKRALEVIAAPGAVANVLVEALEKFQHPVKS